MPKFLFLPLDNIVLLFRLDGNILFFDCFIIFFFILQFIEIEVEKNYTNYTISKLEPLCIEGVFL